MGSIRKVFGARLAALREARGLTQPALAEKAKVSLQTVTFIETGRRWAGSKILEKVLGALKVSPEELISSGPISIRPTPAEALAVLQEALREKELPKQAEVKGVQRIIAETKDLESRSLDMGEVELQAELSRVEGNKDAPVRSNKPKSKARAPTGTDR